MGKDKVIVTPLQVKSVRHKITMKNLFERLKLLIKESEKK